MGNKKGDSEALEEQEFEEEERSKKKKNKTGTQSNSFPLSSVYAIPPSVARLITVQLIGGYNNGPSPDNILPEASFNQLPGLVPVDQ